MVAWVNGHTHIHAVSAVGQDGAPGGFWQITTASHIDWPQQAHLIEVLQADEVLALCCPVVDTDAPPSCAALDGPASLASLARELAAKRLAAARGHDCGRRGGRSVRQAWSRARPPARLTTAM